MTVLSAENREMRVLVTGGAGYIGSHVCVSLKERGHNPVILDNFSTSDPAVIERLRTLVGGLPLVRADVRDEVAVRNAMRRHRIGAVIHCAGLKSVGESCRRPLEYFDNNVNGSIALLSAMRVEGVKTLVFSSSATVYGWPDSCPVTESAPLRVLNPYGRSKLVVEDMIRDASAAEDGLRAAILRYFNPVGAHPSGLIGEAPSGDPTNLMPIICQVADGQREELRVFGGDYPTRDGTGVRDYIHVVDLAAAHVAAIEYLAREQRSIIVNLGTGRGYSVLEVVRAVERASNRSVAFRIVDRREGDAAEVYADPTQAQRLLGWAAQLGLDAMCRDAWRWQSSNPNGYADEGADTAAEMAVVA
jgi:UDP-glucose 4-epimerase